MPGQPPFGYKHADGQLVEDAVEQETIALIRRLKSEGTNKGKGMSYGSIAAHLNMQGVLNRGKYWNPSTLWYIYNRKVEV